MKECFPEINFCKKTSIDISFQEVWYRINYHRHYRQL